MVINLLIFSLFLLIQVYAWKVADDMLHQKKDMESCYFAAQTMRIKIQKCFHELPADSYVSLRDSLLNHISQINKNTNSIIVTQVRVHLKLLIIFSLDYNFSKVHI